MAIVSVAPHTEVFSLLSTGPFGAGRPLALKPLTKSVRSTAVFKCGPAEIPQYFSSFLWICHKPRAASRAQHWRLLLLAWLAHRLL